MGHASQGHSWLFVTMLLLCSAGCCDAFASPKSLGPSSGPRLGNVSGLFWEDGNLDAFNYYLCPTGTLPGVSFSMVQTDHGDAEQQLLANAADGSTVTRVTALAELMWWRAGFPATNCKTAGALASLAICEWNGWGVPILNISSTIFYFLWLFHWYPRSRFRKKRRKKQQSLIHVSKNKPGFIGKQFGPCRWIAGRRFRFRPKRYRLLGLRKRRALLLKLRAERFGKKQTRTVTEHMKTTQFDKVVSWLCGWLGVRVGEASHPGPPDGQQTKRKVDETDWSTHQQDSHLAQALLQVLHSFQQDKKESRQEGNPYKKGKGGPNPKPAGSKLARILLQTLQSALTQGWSDETVAQRLISKITRHGPQENFHGNSGHELSISSFEKGPSESKQALGELLYPKVFAVSPEHAGKVTGMFLEWPVTEIHRLLQSEALLKTKVQEALSCLDKNHVQVPAAKRKLGPQQFHQPAQTWADRAREGPPNNSKGKGKGKHPNDVGTPPFCC